MINIAIKLAISAGLKTLDFYHSDNLNIEYKQDSSPLTEADKASNKIITDGLKSTGIPILSEEGKEIPFDIRKEWGQFWLIDPIDGTKEFIKKNGEFTINIALIEKGTPVMGIIYVPVKKTLYIGSKDTGSRKFENITDWNNIDITNGTPLPVKNEERNIVVGSRSHKNEETTQFIKDYLKDKEYENVSVGSSLKFCLMAEGNATFYPRLGPTMEWDTGAGHAIAKYAGCTVVKTDGNNLIYNKENLLNPHFVVTRE